MPGKFSIDPGPGQLFLNPNVWNRKSLMTLKVRSGSGKKKPYPDQATKKILGAKKIRIRRTAFTETAPHTILIHSRNHLFQTDMWSE